MTDLREHIAEFDAAARRILQTPTRPLAAWQRPAPCHPNRPLQARGLCHRCYYTAWTNGTLDKHPPQRTQMKREHFVADYELLRSEGYTRRQIAERLRMDYRTVDQAYRRAVRAGLLTPDRRAA